MAEEKATSERTYQHWIEIVRTFRTYYDHMRIAFPHLQQIPKHYTNDWASQFRLGAREFARKEDMKAVKRLFDGAGYGSERWKTLTSLPPEAISDLLNQAISANGAPGRTSSDSVAVPEEAERIIGQVREALGEKRLTLLLEDPSAFAEELGRLDALLVKDERTADSGQGGVAESERTEDDVISYFRGVFGEDRWQKLLDDPERVISALDGPPSSGDDSLSQDGKGWSKSEAEQAIKSLEKQIDALTSNLDKASGEKRTLEQDLKKSRSASEDRDRDLQAMSKKVKSLEEKVKDAESQKGKISGLAKLPPTKLNQQLQQYEQAIGRHEARVSELEAKVQQDEVLIKETAEDLKREKYLRQKFEDDLDEARKNLREQIDRLHSVLKGDPEIPSLDEFEQMENEELLEYIGDVEKEKNRVLAGLDAMDAQEQSYQKQIDSQQEELGAIQEDLEAKKESNIAMEVEELRTTVEKQRSQLQTLMGFSKNLRSRNDQMTERQEPLRRLVEKLNLQEKALVRYVRLKYDSKFMPDDVFVRR